MILEFACSNHMSIKDKVLVCDEIELGLHEIIALQIIRFFQQHNKKDTFAQLVFSTHNTSLLDSDLFRRDQIWFTQLKEDRSTDLYTLEACAARSAC